MTARHRAQAAADLAALAGAESLRSSLVEFVGSSPRPAPCVAAAAVAAANGARLDGCNVGTGSVAVLVSVPLPVLLNGFGRATGLARAGPAGS